MKKIMIICVCGLLLAAAGCKHHGGNEPEEPQSFAGNASRPSWTAPTDYDYSSSMTAIVKIDLAAQYPDQAADFQIEQSDLLAAFIGTDCVGVASPQDALFYLYITAPNGSQDQTNSQSANDQIVNSQIVNLRYYSAHYKNLFEATDTFPFQTDAHLGTAIEPYVPKMVEVE